MLDQAIRFGAILAQPEFSASGSILEVGSGSLGITAFINEPVVGVDVCFNRAPAEGMKGITASVTALPFADRSFDRVICSDMLEHIPENVRPAAIKELIRVTRRTLFLACPCGEEARRMDGWLSRLYRFFTLPVPDWLEEHQAETIPDPEAIQSVLSESGVPYREIGGESALAHFVISLLISTKFMNNVWKSIFQDRPDRAVNAAHLARFPGSTAYRRLWIINAA